MKLIAAGTLALALTANVAQPRTALAWGDDGHKVVALIAQSFLDTDVRKRVNALLSADTDSLTGHDTCQHGDLGRQVSRFQYRRVLVSPHDLKKAKRSALIVSARPQEPLRVQLPFGAPRSALNRLI